LQRELFVWRLLFAVVAAGAMIAAAAPQSTHDNPAKLLYVQPISPSATNKLALQKPTDYDFLQLFHWWSKKRLPVMMEAELLLADKLSAARVMTGF